MPWAFLPSGPEVAEWTGPRRPAPPKHDEVRWILREFVLVCLQDLSNQVRLGFDTCSVGAQKDDAQRPASVEERQVAEVLVLGEQDAVLRVGPRKHLVVTYASGGLGDVGDVVALAPQARNNLPLNALVGEYPQVLAGGSLVEDPEYLAGEREGYHRLRPGIPRGTMPRKPGLLGARCLSYGL